MPILHIVAVGPAGSGKSVLVRYLANNPPKGWKLKRENASLETIPNHEVWTLVFEKQRKRNAQSS